MAGAMAGEAESLASVAFVAFIRVVFFAFRIEIAGIRNARNDIGTQILQMSRRPTRREGVGEKEAIAATFFCDPEGNRAGAHRRKLVMALDADLPDVIVSEGTWRLRYLLELVKMRSGVVLDVVADGGEVAFPRMSSMMEHTYCPRLKASRAAWDNT